VNGPETRAGWRSILADYLLAGRVIAQLVQRAVPDRRHSLTDVLGQDVEPLARVDALADPPRSFETVACALSVASAKENPNSAGSKGALAMASRASKMSVGFMRSLEKSLLK